MRTHVFALAATLAAPALAPGADGVAAPTLTREHVHPSGRWSFRTPESWTVAKVADRPHILDARGDGLVMRFVHFEGEQGLDSMHVTCMIERLAPEQETSGDIRYEHDFIGGVIADRRALDSAFTVKYDAKIDGHRDWRQRNVTVVGAGMSLCVIGHVPVAAWKKSKAARALHDAVLGSVSFR
jgi:hypothetical protein